mmetsp:Transcript_24533/g.54612  ORF Transcript_24533/g.54612 Transcript_24533/m.54612 type:complete len:207 (-) Transcript_24533:44-664(-)
MSVSRSGGFLASVATKAPTPGPEWPAVVLLQAISPSLTSEARHRSVPKDVAKTTACSEAMMPHQLMQRMQTRLIQSSQLSPATELLIVVALAEPTLSIFFRAASASCVSPRCSACSRTAWSCSKTSSCNALLGRRDDASNGAMLRGSTGRIASQARRGSQSYVWPLGDMTGDSITRCDIGQRSCFETKSSIEGKDPACTSSPAACR